MGTLATSFFFCSTSNCGVSWSELRIHSPTRPITRLSTNGMRQPQVLIWSLDSTEVIARAMSDAHSEPM